MENGNLVQFMRTSKREDIDHYTLVSMLNLYDTSDTHAAFLRSMMSRLV